MTRPAELGEAEGAAVSTAIVEATGLKKRYGERDALVDVDLVIPAGGCFGIFGPNGSGKTTFLKIVGTLIRPSAGELRVGGHSLPREASRVRALTSVLLDRPFLPLEFTLFEGLRYFADLYQVPSPGARIDELLDRVGLTWRRRDPVRTFSRGMAQRASLACALLPDPPLLILDEPFTGLDPAGCTLVEEVIAERKKAGGSVLLVTHEIERGAQLAEEVVVFDRGRVAFRGARGEWNLDDLMAVYR